MGAIFALAAMIAGCQMASDDEVSPVEGAQMTPSRELIVLAAPRGGDPYYAEVAGDIAAFHIDYARQAEGKDDVLILADAATYTDYVAALGAGRVVKAPADDIWMRDFSPSNAARAVMFRYTAAGQGGGRRGQTDADSVQKRLAGVLRQAGLTIGASDLLNDGGNFIHDFAGRAVVSRKFLRDYALSEVEGRATLRRPTGVSHVAFIDADEQGGLEHADGVAAFIGPNILVINSYPEDPAYAAALRNDL